MKMKILILFGTILLIKATNLEKCKTEIFANCGLHMNDFAKEFGRIFPGDEVELTRQCQIFVETRNCMYNYSINCMTAMDRIVGGFIFSGTAKKMKEFCNPEKQLYKDYLGEAECIKRNKNGVSSCFKDYLAMLRYMDQDSTGSKLKYFCCGLNGLKRCLSDEFKDKCQQKVATLMEMYVEFMYSEWVVEMCKPFYHLLDECPNKSTVNAKVDVKRINEFSFASKYIYLYSQI